MKRIIQTIVVLGFLAWTTDMTAQPRPPSGTGGSGTTSPAPTPPTPTPTPSTGGSTGGGGVRVPYTARGRYGGTVGFTRASLRGGARQRTSPIGSGRVARMNLRGAGRIQVVTGGGGTTPTAPTPTPTGGANTGGGAIGATSPTTTANVWIISTPNAKAYHKVKTCQEINKSSVSAIPEQITLTKAKSLKPPRTPCTAISCYPVPSAPAPQTSPNN